MHMGLGGKRQKKTLLFILFQMAPPPGVGGKRKIMGQTSKTHPLSINHFFNQY